MNPPDPPEDFVRAIRHMLHNNCKILLDRMIKRATYREVYKEKRLIASSSFCTSAHEIAKTLYYVVCKDIQKNPDGDRRFRVTVCYGKDFNNRKSKHFDLFNQKVETLQQDSEFQCKDCKDTGWYVGMIERYPCPTCKGGKE